MFGAAASKLRNAVLLQRRRKTRQRVGADCSHPKALFSEDLPAVSDEFTNFSNPITPATTPMSPSSRSLLPPSDHGGALWESLRDRLSGTMKGTQPANFEPDQPIAIAQRLDKPDDVGVEQVESEDGPQFAAGQMEMSTSQSNEPEVTPVPILSPTIDAAVSEQPRDTITEANRSMSDFQKSYPEFASYVTAGLWYHLKTYRAQNPYPGWTERSTLARILSVPQSLVDTWFWGGPHTAHIEPLGKGDFEQNTSSNVELQGEGGNCLQEGTNTSVLPLPLLSNTTFQSPSEKPPREFEDASQTEDEQDSDSDTETSQDDDTDDLISDVVSSLRTQLVACLIKAVERKPRESTVSSTYTGNTQPSSSGPAVSTTASPGQGSNQRSNHKRPANTRPPPDGDDEGDGDDQGDRKRPKPSEKPPTDQSTRKKLFACPFHKYNPRKYCVNAIHGERFRLCSQRGYYVNRLKEHFRRKHLRPIECLRCFAEFQDRGTLESHQRARQMCEVRERSEAEGITPEKEKELQKVKVRGCSDEEKWNRYYRVLFGNEVELPSPYYIPSIDEEFSPSKLSEALERHHQDITDEALRILSELLESVPPRVTKHEIIGMTKQALDQACGRAVESYVSPVAHTSHLQPATAVNTSDLSGCRSLKPPPSCTRSSERYEGTTMTVAFSQAGDERNQQVSPAPSLGFNEVNSFKPGEASYTVEDQPINVPANSESFLMEVGSNPKLDWFEFVNLPNDDVLDVTASSPNNDRAY